MFRCFESSTQEHGLRITDYARYIGLYNLRWSAHLVVRLLRQCSWCCRFTSAVAGRKMKKVHTYAVLPADRACAPSTSVPVVATALHRAGPWSVGREEESNLSRVIREYCRRKTERSSRRSVLDYWSGASPRAHILVYERSALCHLSSTPSAPYASRSCCSCAVSMHRRWDSGRLWAFITRLKTEVMTMTKNGVTDRVLSLSSRWRTAQCLRGLHFRVRPSTLNFISQAKASCTYSVSVICDTCVILGSLGKQ